MSSITSTRVPTLIQSYHQFTDQLFTGPSLTEVIKEKVITPLREKSFINATTVDTAAFIFYGTASGVVTDMVLNGLSPMECLMTRATAMAINTPAGALYSRLTQKMYDVAKISEDDRAKTAVANLLAFNIITIPKYAALVGISSYVNSGNIDPDLLLRAGTMILVTSPIHSPLTAATKSLFRNLWQRTVK